MKKNYCTIFTVLLISFVLLEIPVCRDILYFHNSVKKVKKRTPTMITNVSKSVFSYGGAGVFKDEHPSEAPVSPSNAVSISSSGILSMLNGFLLALMMRVKWSSYR